MNKINLTDAKDRIVKFKDNLIESKKYWTIYLIFILVSSLSLMGMGNYSHPKMEILAFIVLSIIGIFLIAFHQGHSDDRQLYKTAFIIILVLGIVFSIANPICCNPDEVEHFVRSEITSNGAIFPEYITNPYVYDGFNQSGYYMTIQSVLDLIDNSKDTRDGGFDAIEPANATVYHNNFDDKPINHTPARYHSAFAQNPFFGYLAPAIGIAIAKLLDLSAIWLLWLGRIFNITLYAALVSYAIKKTPILKIPLMVVSLMPFLITFAASVSIDSIIYGLGIVAVAYFFNMYKSDEKSLSSKQIITFTAIVLILGMCKVTYFGFILLLLLVPRDNFKEKKYYLSGFLMIALTLAITALWSTFYVHPGVIASCRGVYYNQSTNIMDQLMYMLSHKKESLISIFSMFTNLNNDLNFSGVFNSIFLLFFGSVCLLYPEEKFKLKTRIGALLVFLALYIGTYILFLLSWTPYGQLTPIGVQPRYFFPMFALIPFIFGINHIAGDKKEIDSYIIMISIAFLAISILNIVIQYY